MEMSEVRKSNLIALIGDPKKRGAVAAFARKHNVDPTYIRQILSDHRPMGEKAARNFEKQLGLPEFYMDGSADKQDILAETVKDLEKLSPSGLAWIKAQIDLLHKKDRGEL